jgi:formiminotetrahydrofolate cyclodeaminase
MKLIDLKVTDFVNEVDKKSATPGGGSVSALASSLGLALTKMVGHLTIGKKKFLALDEDTQSEFNDILDTFGKYKEEMISLIDQDTAAYNLVMGAFKLPKETQEEQTVRNQEIQKATLVAIETPYRIAVLSLEALKDLDFILSYGNKNALSDLGVSALMLYAGVEGSLLNVKINLSGLDDQEIAEDYAKKVKSMLFEARELRQDILGKVHDKL